MSDDIKPFQFVNFDNLNRDNEDPLVKFNIKNRKKFIPQFKRETKYEFRELFSEKGELTIEDYHKQVEEYYLKKKQEAEKEIEEYLKQKKLEANEIVETAKKESDKIKANAFEEGFEKGYSEGLKKGEEKISKTLNELIDLINNLVKFEDKIILENKNGIANLIIKFAKKIVKKELELNTNDILLVNLENILEKIVDKGFIQIKINPQQYDFIMEKINKIKDSYDIEELKIVKSQEISPGSCIVETNFGNYDGRIEEQISELEKALTNNV